jgi:hypothetical protein
MDYGVLKRSKSQHRNNVPIARQRFALPFKKGDDNTAGDDPADAGIDKC